MAIHDIVTYRESKRHAANLKRYATAIHNCMQILNEEAGKEYKPIEQIKKEMVECLTICESMYEVFTKVINFKGVNQGGASEREPEN